MRPVGAAILRVTIGRIPEEPAMRTLVPAFLLLFIAPAPAQDDLSVLKPDGDNPPKKMLYSALQAQAQKHFDARRQTIAALKAPEDVKRRQADLKAQFIKALGGFPERTPLNPRVVGTDKRDGYRVERVIYESRPEHHVTGLLYIPDGKGPFPGVLLPCGHSANGKAAETYQKGAILYARNGLAVLCYDPIGQGERAQLLDKQGKPAIAGSTSEHTLVGVGALLVGDSCASYRIWDGIRSLDYLASRPEVDAKRLGCTGNSGGGTLTSYLMALDDRIYAAAPSCYITSLERLFATIGPQDAEQNITGQVAFGMEHADFITMRAPRPTLIACATRDFFDIQGTWTSFREAKRIFGLMGHNERLDIVEPDLPHSYAKPQREAIVRFMRRWLLDKDDAPTEGDIQVAKDAEVQCTRTGQVLEDLKGRSAFDITAEKDRSFAKQRAAFLTTGTRAERLKTVRELLAVPDTIMPATAKSHGDAKRDGYDLRKMTFETEPGITLPAILFTPRGKDGPMPLVLYAAGDSKAADAAVGGPIEKLVKAGHKVLLLDLRGIGETAPGVPPAKGPNYYGVDWKEAFLGLHLNRPLLGQRVVDFLSVAAWASAEAALKDHPLHAVGTGVAGPIVLHAAALEPRIKEVGVAKSLLSWSQVARSPIGHGQLANVVPGVLKVYDLPDLAGLIAPRVLKVINPLDPVGQPVAQTTLDEAFAPCKTAYEQQKAGKALTLQGAAAPAQGKVDADLPKVVLIGDSIRMGYAPLVAKRLEGKAIIVSAKDNGGDSANVLKRLAEFAIDEKPAIVHFNCGLHDLKVSRKTKEHQVALDKYEANLKEIVARLRKDTSAALIFASTTPIHDERHAKRKGDFDRTEADVQRYNKTAIKVMQDAKIPVHDLHWVVEQGGTEKMLGNDGTHYTPEANARLAEAVADCILRQLIVSKAKAAAPAPGGPEVGAKYREAEKLRDAQVPEVYKKIKVPELPLPANAQAWKQERPEVLKKVLESLGDMPPRPSPQKVRRITRELRPGYTLEKIAIDNGFDQEITCLLLVPEKRTQPAPAILWLHSSTPDKTQIITPHTNGGEEPLGETFVKAGYVVLAPDAYWHGDREEIGPSGKLERYSTQQNSLLKINLWLGRTLWGMFVRDDQIALDYLCSRPEVDRTRIGATGMSMGSTRAWWLAAVDDRIAATCGVACLTRYQNLIRHGQLQAHGVYYFVNGLLKHFDTEGVIALIAPRPVLFLTGDLDHGSPADGIKDIESRVGKLYDTLAARDRFKSTLYADIGHTYTPRMRADMLAWFDQWLKPKP